MEVRPLDLQAAARTLARDMNGVRHRLRRLRAVTDAVAVHPADPSLDADLAIRQARSLAALHRSAADLTAVAGDLDSAALDALVADEAGRWRPLEGWSLPGRDFNPAPFCRLPADLRSAMDSRLTGVVADVLSVVATGAMWAVAPLVSPGSRSRSGDPGGRFSSRPVPFGGSVAGHLGARPLSPAARLVVAALDATADEDLLAHDEFGLVDLGRNRYTVVLPGVTDLRDPQPGWHPHHRSPRDLDMAAIPSSRSTGVDDNVYARSVAEALTAFDVPVGAELVIVGHSFGADTALDLAADPAFTGRYDVTHVVATGYFSQHQLRSASVDTRVLVVQNRRDVVVHLGTTMPSAGTGIVACGPASAVSRPTAVVRFDGGIDGLGHSIDVYRSVFSGRADLDSGDAAAVHDMLDSIDVTSTPPGTMLAVDISLPEQAGRDRSSGPGTGAAQLGPAQW